MAVDARAVGSAALELASLRRTFGDVVALDGLSFSVPSGTFFGFVGRNGAGKTTTMPPSTGMDAATHRRSTDDRWRITTAENYGADAVSAPMAASRVGRTFGPSQRGGPST